MYTLMHYMVKVVEDQFPSLVDFAADLLHCPFAARGESSPHTPNTTQHNTSLIEHLHISLVSLSTMKSEFNNLKKDLTELGVLLPKITVLKDQNDRFVNVLTVSIYLLFFLCSFIIYFFTFYLSNYVLFVLHQGIPSTIQGAIG